MLPSARMTAPLQKPKAAGYYESDRSDFLDWIGGSYERVLEKKDVDISNG